MPRLFAASVLTTGLVSIAAPEVRAVGPVSTIAFAGQVEAPSFNGGQSGNNGLFMDPAGQYLYGVTFGYILKINLSSFSTESQVDLSSASYSYLSPEKTVTSADGSKAYIVGTGDNGTYVRSLTTSTGLADPTTYQLTSSTGMHPQDIAVANVPNVGPVAYVTTSGWGYYNTQPTMYILNLTSGNVTTFNLAAQGFVQGQQSWVAVSSDGTKAYLSTPSNGIKVMDTATNTITRTIAGVGGLVATSKTGNLVYSIPSVGWGSTSTMKVIDTANSDATTTVPLTGASRSISVAANGDVAIGLLEPKVDFWDASAGQLVTTPFTTANSSANSIGIHIDENQTFGRCIFTSDNYNSTFTALSIDGGDCGPFGRRFSNPSASLAIGSSASLNITAPSNSSRESQWVALAVFKDETRIRLIQPPFPSQVITQYAEADGAMGLTYRAYNAANLSAGNVASVNNIDWNTPYRESHTLPIQYRAFNADKIVSGPNHSCGIASGVVWCWGGNSDGELGDGTTTDRKVTTKVVDGNDGFVNSGVTDVIVGDGTTCAIKGGSIWCWGNNSYGQLGDGTTNSSSTPIKVDDVNGGFTNANVTSVAANDGATCVVANGKVYCWGYDSSGKLGNDSGSDSNVPTAVVDVQSGFTNANVTKVTAGNEHFCAIADGKIYCWGAGTRGQLGNGASTSSQVPVLVADGSAGFSNSGITHVTGGYRATCAISGAKAYCWGYNSDDQLGDGTGNNSNVPVAVADVNGGFTNANVTDIRIGEDHACAVAGAKVYCWGVNGDGQLGDGTGNDSSTAVQVADVNGGFTNANVTMIAAGYTVTCAIAGGGAYCWGAGSSGKLGNGTTTASDYAVAVCCERTANQNSSGGSSGGSTGGSSGGSGSGSTSGTSNSGTLVITDPTVYKRLPRKVSDYSSLHVLTPEEAVKWDVETATPGTCAGTKTDLVALGAGKCVARIVVEKTHRVVRTLRTTVVPTDVATLKVGNETYVQSPMYFENGSASLKAGSSKGIAAVAALAGQASAVVVAGHTGSLLGNDGMNAILSRNRARTVVNALKAAKVAGPFAIVAVGDNDPVTTKTSQTAQNRNRRVVVVLIP